jgi:cation transport ATPase
LSFRPSSCSRQTRRIIWQIFAGTIAVDTAGICVAVGLLNPALAAFIHVASEMVFILNSARFLPSRKCGDCPRSSFGEGRKDGPAEE